MRELQVKCIYKKKGIMKNLKVRAFALEVGDSMSVDEQGITKQEFHTILDKASQPIKKDKSKPE